MEKHAKAVEAHQAKVDEQAIATGKKAASAAGGAPKKIKTLKGAVQAVMGIIGPGMQHASEAPKSGEQMVALAVEAFKGNKGEPA